MVAASKPVDVSGASSTTTASTGVIVGSGYGYRMLDTENERSAVLFALGGQQLRVSCAFFSSVSDVGASPKEGVGRILMDVVSNLPLCVPDPAGCCVRALSLSPSPSCGRYVDTLIYSAVCGVLCQRCGTFWPSSVAILRPSSTQSTPRTCRVENGPPTGSLLTSNVQYPHKFVLVEG